jgi:KDO2-lipid IV(A) lauroyltransferase
MKKRESWLTRLVFIFFKGLSFFPLPLLYFLSDVVIYPVVYYVVRYRRRVAAENLRSCFPTWSEHQLKVTEKRFYRHFCDCFVETIHILSMSEKEALKRMQLVDTHVITDFASQGKGVLLLLGHYGNWEFVTFLFLAMVKAGNQAGFSVYKPLKSKSIDYLYQRIRTHFGSGIVTKEETYRTIIRLRRAGIPALFGLVSDQSPTRQNLEFWTTFLNQDTAFISGTERMAKQTGFAVVYADMEKVGRGRYRTTCRLITDHPEEEPEGMITERYARLLETTILRDPAYWLWTHRRWKHRRANSKTESTR